MAAWPGFDRFEHRSILLRLYRSVQYRTKRLDYKSMAFFDTFHQWINTGGVQH